jgi:hypothetical protein
MTEATLPEGWVLTHEQPEEVVTLSETQGRAQYNPAVLTAEKQINGSLVNVQAADPETLAARAEAVEANVQAFKTDPVGAPVSEAPTFTTTPIDPEDPLAEAEATEVEVNDKTVITADGAYTEEEWAGRSRTDTIVTDDGQTVYAGVGEQTEEIDAALDQTAADAAAAENEKTKDPFGDTEAKQVDYSTADTIDQPGQSAGGTIIVPAEADTLQEASQLMDSTAREAENRRVLEAQGIDVPETPTNGDDNDDDNDEPAATAGAQEAADELGVDLSQVEGTGKGGKITKADVEQHANG